MILRSLICILILLANLTLADESQPEYFVKRDENHFKQRDYPKLSGTDYDRFTLLYVLDGGKRYLIEPDRSDWYLDSFHKEVELTVDLDNDGVKEAVLRTHGGGNCCGPTFFIVDKVEDGFFSVLTHEELTGWPSVSIKDGTNGTEIWVHNLSEGYENTSQERTLAILTLKNGKLELRAKYFNHASLVSELEVTAAEVSSGENKILEVDLDLDGKMDQMVCSYWARWGAVSCDINSSQHGEFHLSGGCNRIGVLETTTNGMRDLVCNRDDIFRFNREEARYNYGNE